MSQPQVLPPPDKPSIAVLPFQNMSGDPEQEYFADGMAEDIITALSRFKALFVIARNSSFTYKGRAVDVKQVGRELGVRYVLEGSVRKAANRVRITGQLVDTATGAHLWADRFDGGLGDIFDLQDQVTESVVGAIAPAVEKAEIERAKRKPTESLDAYALYLRGLARLYQFAGRQANDQAMRLSPLDPWVTRMRSGTAHAHFLLGRYDEAASWAAMALHDRPDWQTGLRIDAASNAMAGRPEQAHKAMARLRRLNPVLRVSTLKDLLGPWQREDLLRYEEGLRRAGLPE